MEPEQPYRPPSAHLSACPVAGRDATAITANMVQFLAGTRPWVVLLGVLGMIGCGLVVMVAVVLLGLGNAMGVDGLDSLGGAALGLVYIFLAFLYFFPSLYLLRYGRAIKRVRGRGDVMAAEDALRHQAKFWRFVGITPPGKPPPLAVRLEEALPFRRVIDDLLSMNREVQKRRSTCESGKANRT